MKRKVDLKLQELVGKLVCERRVELGITQLQLVSTAGEGHGSPSWLRKVERGEVGCALSAYYRIFAALGLEPRDVLPTLQEVGLESRAVDLPDPTPLRSAPREVGGIAFAEQLARQGQEIERGLLESRGSGEPPAERDPEPDAA